MHWHKRVLAATYTHAMRHICANRRFVVETQRHEDVETKFSPQPPAPPLTTNRKYTLIAYRFNFGTETCLYLACNLRSRHTPCHVDAQGRIIKRALREMVLWWWWEFHDEPCVSRLTHAHVPQFAYSANENFPFVTYSFHSYKWAEASRVETSNIFKYFKGECAHTTEWLTE